MTLEASFHSYEEKKLQDVLMNKDSNSREALQINSKLKKPCGYQILCSFLLKNYNDDGGKLSGKGNKYYLQKVKC